VSLFIQKKKVLKGKIIVTSLQKALREQGELLSCEVRRTSPCPCPGAPPGTGPWALALGCCLCLAITPSSLLRAGCFFSKVLFVQNARK